VHDGLSGLVAEQARIDTGDGVREFDGLWSGGLSAWAAAGKPQIDVLDVSARAQVIGEVFEVTTKPMVVDVGHGGTPTQLAHAVRTLERLGCSAAVIDDDGVPERIERAKQAQVSEAFMVFVRLAAAGVEEMAARATACLAAGADALLIDAATAPVLAFAERHALLPGQRPLAIVASADVGEAALLAAGVRIVVYDSQLLRAAYPAMRRAAEALLGTGQAEALCVPAAELVALLQDPGAE